MSQEKSRRKFSGFTIPEVLLGLIVCGMTITVAVVTYSMMSQMWKESLAMNELSRNANVAIEKMIHGMPVNTGLLAAKSISTPASGASADNVIYTDCSGSNRSFYLSGTTIKNEGNDPIVSDVELINFSNTNNAVRIELKLHKYVRSKEIKLSVETQVVLRN